MDFLFVLTLILGPLGILAWAYVIFCLHYKKIWVDRIIAVGHYWQVLTIVLLIGIMPFSIAFIAWTNDIQPYDLLYSNNLYGQGSDLEAKLFYRQSILDKVAEQSEDPSLVGTVFFHFRGIGTQYAAGTPKGRHWAFAIGVIGSLLVFGLLIPIVFSILKTRTEKYNFGTVRYNIQKSPYAVIFGAHETVPELVKRILSDQHKHKIKYIIIQTTENVFHYRQSLEARLSKKEISSLILYNGVRTTPKEIADLHLERAKEVYVLGEKSGLESESDHDSLNMECIRNIAQDLQTSNRPNRLQCYVLYDFQTTFTSFLFSDLSQIVKKQIEFISINYYELWAQNVLSRPQPLNSNRISYLPLEGKEKIDKDCEKNVHLIIVGMSKMGIAMALEAAHVAHYPNFCSKGIRTKISFIEPNVDTEMQYFMGRYPDLFKLCRWRKIDIKNDDIEKVEWNDSLNAMAELKRQGKTLSSEEYPYAHLSDEKNKDANFLDIEWEFIKGSIETPEIKEYLIDVSTNKNEIVTVAICRTHSPQAIATGIYMPREVYRNAVQVLIYQTQSSDIIYNISGTGLDEKTKENMRYNNLRPFGMLSNCFSSNIVDNRLAKLVNYVYHHKDDTDLAKINDIDPESKLTRQEECWRECSVSDQWSSGYNANSIITKLRFLGLDFRISSVEEMKKTLLTEESMNILSEVEHNRWNTEKLLMGYRPLETKEVEIFMDLKEKGVAIDEYYQKKREFKNGWEMAHLDICSFEKLKSYDEPSIEYDEVLTKAFPAIVETMRNSKE